MSWLCRDPAIFEEDLEVLDFEPTESRLFLIKRQNNALDYAESWTIKTCADWKQWLETDRSERQCLESSRLNLVIAGRAEFPWKHDPSALSTLPWSYQIFSRIQRRFLVHSGIVRTINRNTSCMFSPMSFEWNLNDSKQKSLVYLCRTTASWSGDMALSVTFIPSTLTTNAVLFGCDLKKPDMYDDRLTLADIITSRLKNSDTPVFHPMMLPTIFADVERDRQIELVREKLEQLGRRIDRIAFKKPTVKPSAIPRSEMETLDDDEKAMSSPFGAHHLQQGMSTSSGSTTLNEDKGLVPPCTFPDEESLPTAKLWQQISRLRVGLSNWRRQLLKMISHVEDLNRVEFAPRGPFNSTYREEQRLQFFLTGERIRDRT